MFSWAFIGLFVGSVMGFTGAGAAMVSVPLFIHVAGASLLEATTFALYAVFLGSTLNCVISWKDVQPKVSLIIFGFSLAASSLAAWYKPLVSPLVIQGIFGAVCLYSLTKVWKKVRTDFKIKNPWLAYVIIGVLIGTLVTLTGLGGGFLLVPFFLGSLGMAGNKAVATSLFTIFLNVTGSIFSQFDTIQESFVLENVVGLGLGIILSASLLKALVNRMPVEKVTVARRWALTILISSSIIGVFYA